MENLLFIKSQVIKPLEIEDRWCDLGFQDVDCQLFDVIFSSNRNFRSQDFGHKSNRILRYLKNQSQNSSNDRLTNYLPCYTKAFTKTND